MIRSIFLLVSLLIGGCAATPPASDDTTPAMSTRLEVQNRLQTHMATDPNVELCERVTARLMEGDIEALTPEFDTAAFGERIIAHASLAMQDVDYIRSSHDKVPNFTRFHFPKDLKFLCLGTRQFMGADHLVIRNWQPGRFDYLLLRLTAENRVEDYLVVSSGAYHSELQNLAFNSKYSDAMKIVGMMLRKSFDQDFAGILADYKTLPAALQEQPVVFLHFINAAFFGEDPGQPNYDKAFKQLDTVMAGRVYSIAYWKMSDAARRNDRATDQKYRQVLLELLDDYELLQ